MDWIGAMSVLSVMGLGGAVLCTSCAGSADGACGGPLGVVVVAAAAAVACELPLSTEAGAGDADADAVAGLSSGVGSLSIGMGPSSEAATGCC